MITESQPKNGIHFEKQAIQIFNEIKERILKMDENSETEGFRTLECRPEDRDDFLGYNMNSLLARKDLSLFNANGLRKGVSYIFNEDGTVNWRAMIPPKYLYQNKGRVNKKIADLTEKGETVNPEWLDGSIEGLADSELLITLPGIKWLANLRGYSCVKHNSRTIDAGFATDTCSITWRGNFETDFEEVTFSEVGSCSAVGNFSNCKQFWGKFAESLAANRAFIRAVRGFLGIEVYGGDEMDQRDEEKETNLDAQAKIIIETITKTAEEKGVNSYLAFLKLPSAEANSEFARFKKFGELPPKLRYAALNILKGIN